MSYLLIFIARILFCLALIFGITGKFDSAIGYMIATGCTLGVAWLNIENGGTHNENN